MIRIIIADDDHLITESLKIIFELDDQFELVGAGHTGAEAVKLCLNNAVDVALLDIRMPEMNGVEATKKIVAETNTKVLILTTFDEDDFIKEAFLNGASGYLLKKNPPDQIKNAIFSVYGGNVVMQDSVLRKMGTGANEDDFSGDQKFELLTEREVEIVQAIAKGFTNKEIAEKLYLSEGTIKNCVSSILNKLQLKHRTQIAIYYLKR
jgi:DNA-binding NarL/FixJ family response regulator